METVGTYYAPDPPSRAEQISRSLIRHGTRGEVEDAEQNAAVGLGFRVQARCGARIWRS